MKYSKNGFVRINPMLVAEEMDNTKLAEVYYLKCEDAFYYKNMLMLGFSDGYDAWLNSYLESEDPLSDTTLELSFCGSDINKIVSVLHNYCLEQPFDEAIVCDKLRSFFKKIISFK